MAVHSYNVVKRTSYVILLLLVVCRYSLVCDFCLLIHLLHGCRLKKLGVRLMFSLNRNDLLLTIETVKVMGNMNNTLEKSDSVACSSCVSSPADAVRRPA